jgi:pSer/pThr/pTyr-binding forkhead associated (FHA) protein
MTTIIVTHENNEVEEFKFETTQRVISIGRRSTNDVCIPDLSVSGNHAKITLQDGHAWLEDLNSTNGTYVNGQVIFRHSVVSGDDIMMGKLRLAILRDASADAAGSVDSMTRQPPPGSHTSRPSSSYADDSYRETHQQVSSEPAHASDQHKIDQGEAYTANPKSELAARESSSAPDRRAFDTDDATPGFSPRPADKDSRQTETPGGSPIANGVTATHDSESQGSEPKAKDSQHPLDGLEHLVVPPDKAVVTPMHELDSPSNPSKGAVIEIKNGAKSGQILPIDKPVTTLGRPGIQIAAIMRKPDGYFLMHIESDDSVDRPTLNRDAIGDEPVLLHSGDELNVAGIDVEFMLS